MLWQALALLLSRGLGTLRREQLQSFGFKGRVTAWVPKNELESLSTGSVKIFLVSVAYFSGNCCVSNSLM